MLPNLVRFAVLWIIYSILLLVVALHDYIPDLVSYFHPSSGVDWCRDFDFSSVVRLALHFLWFISCAIKMVVLNGNHSEMDFSTLYWFYLLPLMMDIYKSKNQVRDTIKHGYYNGWKSMIETFARFHKAAVWNVLESPIALITTVIILYN